MFVESWRMLHCYSCARKAIWEDAPKGHLLLFMIFLRPRGLAADAVEAAVEEDGGDAETEQEA